MKLRPTHYDEIPSALGRAAQAWFLGSLAGVNEIVAKTIHDSEGLKPFTISNLMPDSIESPQAARMRHDGQIGLTPDQRYTLRITTLNRDLTQLVLNGLLPVWLSDGVTLHDQTLRVEEIITDTERDLWAGVTDYADLLAAFTTGQGIQHLDRRLAFTFAGPTSFNKTGGQQMPLPLPDLVFGSLLTRWNAYAGSALHPDLLTVIREQVVIHYHRIRSEQVSFERSNRGTVTGFKGDVTYHVQTGDSFWLGQLHTLAAYAVYAGVGVRTAMGMGMAISNIQGVHRTRLQASNSDVGNENKDFGMHSA
jgi:CRISPR-associated endoribonuclease Cas6